MLLNTPILVISWRILDLLKSHPGGIPLLPNGSSFYPPQNACGDFLFLFTESGELTSLAPECPEIRLLLSSAPRGPMFRCSQLGGGSKIEIKAETVTRSLRAQSDVITHLDYTSQGLKPHSQEKNPE